MKKYFLFLFLLLGALPMLAEGAVEYHIDEVFRKMYPRPEWYIKLTTDDGNWTFCYDILTDEIQPGKVYTIDDMLKSDCQAYDNFERVSHKFETATYCETYAEDGTLMIEATATTEDGMDIILHYGIDPLPVAKDTIDVVTRDVELQDLTLRGAAMFIGKTEDLLVSVGVKSKQIAGEYKTDQLYLSFCYIQTPEDEVPIGVLDGHVTIEAIERGYTVEGYLLAENAYCYHVQFTYEVPEPLETRILKCDNLNVNTSYVAQFGEVIYEASNEDWELEIWVNTDKPLGYFSGNIVDASYSVLTNRHTKEMVDLYYAEFVVGTDETSVFLRGGMMARDQNYYILELTCPLTVDTRTVELDIADGGLFDNTANNNLQLYGKTADGKHYVSLALKTTEMTTATFDRSQTYRDYTYVEEFTPDFPVFYEPYLATINLIPEEGGMYVEAYLRCDNLGNEEDHPLFIVRMHCKPEDVQLGLKFDSQNADFSEFISTENVAIDDSYLEDGYVYLDGYDPTSRCTFSLEFNVDSLDPEIGIPAGVYSINDSWNAGTISVSRGVQDGVVWPSYVAYGDADGNLDIPVWLLQAGTATVENVDGKLTMTLDGTNSCNRKVHLVVGTVPEGIQRISTSTSSHASKMLTHGGLLIKKGTRLYNVLGKLQ